MEENRIDTQDVRDRFENFLKIEDNDRLIFSGIFGIGKTTFLHEFFDEHENYIALHIYPVNYSVASNEDIFELIKYDILYEILNKISKGEGVFETMDVSKISAIPFLEWGDVYKIIKPFIKAIPIINKSVPDILEAFENLFSVLETKKNEFNEGDQEKKIKTFLKRIENESGSIYERDVYTHLIISLISQIRNHNNKNRKVVLIIDDLDRIDPEHIFRILNVFAAHFDSSNSHQAHNKFEFDKIILTCDIRNIRNIFHYKYGVDVDFNGYIDKFCSTEVFYFDIRQSIKQALVAVLSSVKNNRISLNQFVTNFQIIDFIKSMVDSNTFNLRNLTKYVNKPYTFKSIDLSFQNGEVNNHSLNMFLTFEFITSLIGSTENTKRAIADSNLVFRKNDIASWNKFISELIFIIDHKNHRFLTGLYKYDLQGLILGYEVTTADQGRWRARINSLNGAANPTALNDAILSLRHFIDLKELILNAYTDYVKHRTTS